jgi:hypothetical protein
MKVYEVTVYAGHEFDKVKYRQFWADGVQAFKDEAAQLKAFQDADAEWARSYWAEVKQYEVK